MNPDTFATLIEDACNARDLLVSDIEHIRAHYNALKASHDRLLSALKAILEGLDTENKAAPWHVRDAESAIAQAEALEK